MRKSVFFSLAAAVALFAACDPQNEPVIVPVSLNSAGIYAADNKDLAISKDYVVTSVAANDVVINLPSTVNVDALSKVVVAYTLSDTTAVITLDGEVIATRPDSLGVYRDTIDATVKHDVLLNLDKAYAQYELSVVVAEASFKYLTESKADTLYAGPKIAYDAASDIVYVAGYTRKKDNANVRAMLYEFSSNENISAKVMSEGRANCVGVSVANGKVYVGYNDYNGGTSAKFTTIVSPTADSFSYVGTRASLFLCGAADCPKVYADADNNVLAAYQNNKAQTSPVLDKRLLNISKFDGSAWTNAAVSIAGRDATHYAFVTRQASYNGKNYLLCMNQNANSFSIYEYASTGFNTVIENRPAINQNGEDVLVGSDGKSVLSFYLDFAVAADGIYLAYQVKFDGELWQLGVEKIDAEGKATFLGAVEGTKTTAGGIQPCIAVNAEGVPYVSYKDPTTKRLYVSHYDAETAAMSDPEVLNSEAVCDENPIIFTKSGKGYVFSVAAGGAYPLMVYTTK